MEQNGSAPVDFARGAALLGSQEVYRRVLEAFVRTTPERLSLLPGMAQSDLPAFVIEVHGMKSGCASLGALEMSERARELEQLGRQGDGEGVRERLGAFLDCAAGALEAAREYLRRGDVQ